MGAVVMPLSSLVQQVCAPEEEGKSLLLFGGGLFLSVSEMCFLSVPVFPPEWWLCWCRFSSGFHAAVPWPWPDDDSSWFLSEKSGRQDMWYSEEPWNGLFQTSVWLLFLVSLWERLADDSRFLLFWDFRNSLVYSSAHMTFKNLLKDQLVSFMRCIVAASSP